MHPVVFLVAFSRGHGDMIFHFFPLKFKNQELEAKRTVLLAKQQMSLGANAKNVQLLVLD